MHANKRLLDRGVYTDRLPSFDIAGNLCQLRAYSRYGICAKNQTQRRIRRLSNCNDRLGGQCRIPRLLPIAFISALSSFPACRRIRFYHTVRALKGVAGQEISSKESRLDDRDVYTERQEFSGEGF